jgi:Ca2+/Na+ antiporter
MSGKQEVDKMNTKNLAIGTIVGTVVLYALAYLIFEVLLVDFFEANSGMATGVARDSQIVWALVLGTALYALLITLAIDGKSGQASAMDGLKIGAVVGLLLWGTADFTLYGLQDVNNLTATITDTVVEGVRGGLAGLVVAITLAKI